MTEEGKWVFKGICVSCIKVSPKPDENGEDTGIVVFKDSDETGEEARFLVDVIQTGEGEFEGKTIDAEEVKEMIGNEIGEDATPLFCVHGFYAEISQTLNKNTDMGSIVTALPKFKSNGGKYYPIPVLWPCENGNDLLPIDQLNLVRQYKKDQNEWSQNAGKMLKTLVGNIDDNVFPKKSLMMHSMGNHVVFNGACGFQEAPDVQFENIFMVAADVPFDIFHKEPNNNYRWNKVFAKKELKATNFFKMLEKKTDSQGNEVPKGKVYILHNHKDEALDLSSKFLNGENRLGQRGAGMYKSFWNNSWYDDKQKELIRSEYYDYIENIDFTVQAEGSEAKHNYQFEDSAIKKYNEKALKE